MKTLLYAGLMALAAGTFTACDEKGPVVPPVGPPPGQTTQMVYEHPILEWGLTEDELRAKETHDFGEKHTNIQYTQFTDGTVLTTNTLFYYGNWVNEELKENVIDEDIYYRFNPETNILFSASVFVTKSADNVKLVDDTFALGYKLIGTTESGSKLYSNRVDEAINGEKFTYADVYTSPQDASVLIIDYLSMQENTTSGE